MTFYQGKKLGCIAQLVTCMTANPGVVSSIPACLLSFVEIDHEIILAVILLPSPVVGYK